MTGISSWVIIRDSISDSIRDSIIIDIPPYSWQDIPEFYFRDPIGVFDVIGFGTIIGHNICRVFLSPIYHQTPYNKNEENKSIIASKTVNASKTIEPNMRNKIEEIASKKK